MSFQLRIVLSLLFITCYGDGNAQCTSQETAGLSCLEAPLLTAENLSSNFTFCSALPLSNPIEELNPFCDGLLGTSENTAFLQFYPSSTDLTFLITPMNCDTLENSSGSFSGIQSAVFPACNYQQSTLCSAGCKDEPFEMALTNLDPGTLYIIVFDGCNGSFCEFEITLSNGALMGLDPGSEPQISGPLQVCENESALYSITQLGASATVNWDIASGNSFSTVNNGKLLNISSWGSIGSQTICAQIELDPPTGGIIDTCWQVEVLSSPLIINISTDTALCSLDLLQLNIDGQFYDEIEWLNYNSQLSCADCDNPIFTMPAESVVLKVNLINSSTGCTTQRNIKIDLRSTVECLNSADEIEMEPAIEIYPNPAASTLYLANVQRKTMISIVNAQGQIVMQTSYGDQGINVGNLASGIYYLLTSDDMGIRRLLPWVKK